MKPMSKEEYDKAKREKEESGKRPILGVDTSAAIVDEDIGKLVETWDEIKKYARKPEGMDGEDIERLKKNHGFKDELIGQIAVCVRPKGSAKYTKGKCYRIHGAHHYNEKICSIEITNDKGERSAYSPKAFRILDLEKGAILRFSDGLNRTMEIEIDTFKWTSDHSFNFECSIYELDESMEAVQRLQSNSEDQNSELIKEILAGNYKLMDRGFDRALEVSPDFNFMQELQEL